MTKTLERETITDVLPKLENVKRSGNGWNARCPAHDDKHNSLSIKEGDKQNILFKCHAGCPYDAIRDALGLAHASNGHVPHTNAKSDAKRIAATYDYTDESGVTLYQVVGYEPKKFLQRRPNGAGDWTWNLKDVRRVLYRLPELINADSSQLVFICEGEKDCDRLAARGLIATTNAGGAGKWRDEYNKHLRGRDVVILPDNDNAGRDHAEKVARSLHGRASRVRVLRLPELPDKGDVSDWMDAGGSEEWLCKLAEDAPDWTPSDEPTPTAGDGESLISIGRRAELWHTPTGEVYASFTNAKGHFETCELASDNFKQHLRYAYWKANNGATTSTAIDEAIEQLASFARYEGTERKIFTRCGAHDGTIHLDLCDEQRRIVAINGGSWQVINAKDAPVRFRRAKGMLPLPEPMAGGDVQLLRQFVNVANTEDFILLLAWLVAALCGFALKFPVLSITGEQGSAKSTVTAFLRELIDPNAAPLRNAVRNSWDMTLAANNSWCIALNNLSDLHEWMSDTLCCIADGAGFAARTHHSMNEETIFQAARPIILNGIEDIATRADLQDRAVCLHLPAIAETARKDETEMKAAFDAARPKILGGLLNGVCAAIRNLPKVDLPKLPRMAAFAKWATAAESGLGLERGAFIKAYTRNRREANESAVEASAVATALLAFMRDGQTKETTFTLKELLDALTARFGERKPPDELKSTRKLANELRRYAPSLRAAGCEISPKPREAGTGLTVIEITLVS